MILTNTYLLTDSGWDIVQNLTKGQKICGLSNNEFSSATITKIEKIKYTGKIYTLNKSPLHPKTKLLTKKHRFQNISNIQTTKNIKTICPTYHYSGYRINPIQHAGQLFDTCLIMKIIGYFVECGHLKDKYIVFDNSELKMKYIAKTLKQLNIKNNLYTTNKGTLLYSNDEYLYDFLLQFRCGVSTYGYYKYIPRKFLNMDKCYLWWLLCSMMSSSTNKDIIITPKNPTIRRLHFITSSRILTDNLQEISIKLGYYFNTSILYTNPMKYKQYNPLTPKRGTLSTFMSNFTTTKDIVKSEITTHVYSVNVEDKLELTLIRNNSKPLFVSF